MKPKLTPNLIPWIIFLTLLAVLIPHTAWWFSKFQDDATATLPLLNLPIIPGHLIAWFVAIVFEGTIAYYTHKLAQHIEHIPNYKDTRKKFAERYLNAYGLVLVIAWLVSTIANYAYALEFAAPVKLFTDTGIPIELGAAISGGILPLCSLLFARALSNVHDAEPELNEAEKELDTKLRKANKTISDQNTEIQRLNTQVEKLNTYRTIFDADRDAAERVPIAHRTFPDASQNALSQIMNIPKATLNAHWPTNGHHRTPTEQE